MNYMTFDHHLQKAYEFICFCQLEIIAENLIANQKLEEELWNEQKNKASNAVEEVTVQFFKDEIIVN